MRNGKRRGRERPHQALQVVLRRRLGAVDLLRKSHKESKMFQVKITLYAEGVSPVELFLAGEHRQDVAIKHAHDQSRTLSESAQKFKVQVIQVPGSKIH